MRAIFTLFVWVALICLGGCKPMYPDGDEECNYGYSKSRYVGVAYLDSAFRVWTNPPSQNMRFINSNGGEFAFSVKVQNSLMESELEKMIQGKTPCDADSELYAWVERDWITYSSHDMPFDFDLTRSLYFNDDEFVKNPDTLVGKKEYIFFSVGSSGARYYLSDTTGAYFDQYKLLDSVYYRVYVFENKNVDQQLHPSKFFLQKESGLIGFELSNQEVWAIK